MIWEVLCGESPDKWGAIDVLLDLEELKQEMWHGAMLYL